MDIDQIREIIRKRYSLELNDDFGLMECWKQEVDILLEDIPETIRYFEQCSDHDFDCLSEVFDELIDRSQSRELYQTMCDRYEKIQDPDIKKSVATDIDLAGAKFKDK